MPFTLDMLMEAAGFSVDLPVILRSLLGGAGEVWEKAGGGQTAVVLPRQLVWHVLNTLTAVQHTLASIADSREAAERSFAVVTELSKKRRASN